MASPAVAEFTTYVFRDAKGQTARIKLLIGGATAAVLLTNQNALVALLQAVSNAHVYCSTLADTLDHAYGTAANYQNVEDKAKLAFLATPSGAVSRYQIPAPKTAEFLADEETVDKTETNMAALIAAFQTYAYSRVTDTSPLAYQAGVRVRGPLRRRTNIFTKDPTETVPEE